MRNLRAKKVKYLTPSHTANKWQSQISNPRSMTQPLHYKQNGEYEKASLEKIKSNRDITNIFQSKPPHKILTLSCIIVFQLAMIVDKPGFKS